MRVESEFPAAEVEVNERGGLFGHWQRFMVLVGQLPFSLGILNNVRASAVIERSGPRAVSGTPRNKGAVETLTPIN